MPGSAAMTMMRVTVPAKAILFGEHAVNRGATALAVSVGRYATCSLQAVPGDEVRLSTGDQAATWRRDEVLSLGQMVDSYLAQGQYDAVQRLAADNFWAPHVYLLAALGDGLPGFAAEFASSIPRSAGLGSGGAAFVALAVAALQSIGREAAPRVVAALARRGDVVAHGGIASGLDTQTSLFGGAIRYTAEREGEPIPYASGLALVVGNTHVFAATSEINGRVRRWLAEQPVRLHYFHEIGLLARHAEVALATGDWPELGRLMNINQLILERIGVSCPELEQLNQAALAAGAWGAKLSGSGGGGIMIALVDTERAPTVAAAITEAGGEAIVAPVGVAGATIGLLDDN
jgi:mevalonate kinase